MAHWIKIALLLAGLIWAPQAWATDGGTSAPPLHQPVWLAFGDSLTALTNFAPPEGPWHQIVATHFGIPVINAGLAGDSTERAFGRLLPDVIAHQPDLVFVMFGINDQMIYNGSMHGAFRVPPPQFAWNLSTMVNAIQYQGAQVILLNIRPLIQGPEKGDGHNFFLNRRGDGGRLYPTIGATHDSVPIYNDIIRRIAQRKKAILVDVWGAVVAKGGGDTDAHILAANIDRPGLDNDGVHLGPGGHRLIAKLVIEALEAVDEGRQACSYGATSNSVEGKDSQPAPDTAMTR